MQVADSKSLKSVKKPYTLVKSKSSKRVVGKEYTTAIKQSSVSPTRKVVAGSASPSRDKKNLRVDEIMKRAAEVFENREIAQAWMRSPKKSLNNATPLALCESEKGAVIVRDMLGRIEHGVYS